MGFTYAVPEIVGGTVLVIEQIESQNYVAGTSGWAIMADGSAEFANLVARGSLVTGVAPNKRIEINGTAYPNQIALYSGNVSEVTPGLIRPVLGGANYGLLELRSPDLVGTGQYAWLELDGYNTGATVATLSADDVDIEAGNLVDVIGFGSGVRIGSDRTAGQNISVTGNAVTDADLSSGTNVFPSLPYSVAYSGTTDANGFLTVTHGAGFTPAGGWAATTNPASSFAQFWGIDTIGATTVRLRFTSAAALGALASTAVQGRLFLVR